MEKKAVKKTIIKKVTTPKKVVTPKLVAATPVTPEIKYCRYVNKNIKISPRKLRLLANSIKKLSPTSVLVKLSLTNTKAARVLARAIETVVSVAKNNYNLSPESLQFDTIIVNEGLKIKRMDKSHGSHFARGTIVKRHSRLKIIVKGQVK